MFSTRRINSIVQGFFYYFYGRISTSVQVDYNGISTLENVFNLKNIYLCVSVFPIFIEEYLPLCEFWWKCYIPEEYTPLYEWFSIFCVRVFSTLENILYQKNIHLSLSVFQFFFNKENFPLYKLTKIVFSTQENVI